MEHTKFKKYTKEKTIEFEVLVEQHAGLSFEKQLRFGELIGDEDWQLDMTEGTISFGELAFPIQVIGSFSFQDNSWMCAWANTQSGLPENLLQQSYKLRELGEEEDIDALSSGHFNVAEEFVHQIGLFACGFFETKSYYCANYGQGILVVTIDSDAILAIDKRNVEAVGPTLSQLISSIELDHKNVFFNYLIDREFLINLTNDAIEGLKEETIVKAEFDDWNRLSALESRLC
ncbi:MAG: hypothetical protein JKY03_04615 [Aureispira sp.]|nr:hypothetical protein [Aureispira sp.]